MSFNFEGKPVTAAQVKSFVAAFDTEQCGYLTLEDYTRLFTGGNLKSVLEQRQCLEDLDAFLNVYDFTNDFEAGPVAPAAPGKYHISTSELRVTPLPHPRRDPP